MSKVIVFFLCSQVPPPFVNHPNFKNHFRIFIHIDEVSDRMWRRLRTSSKLNVNPRNSVVTIILWKLETKDEEVTESGGKGSCVLCVGQHLINIYSVHRNGHWRDMEDKWYVRNRTCRITEHLQNRIYHIPTTRWIISYPTFVSSQSLMVNQQKHLHLWLS